MNQTLYQRNLETSVQQFNKSRKHSHACSGSNKWWEERIMQEPINKSVFQQMHNSKYLTVITLTFYPFLIDRY